MINFHGGGDYVETTVKNNLSSGYVLTAPFWTDAYSDFHGSLHSNYNLLRNLLNVGRAYNQDNTNYTLAAYTAATGLGAQSVEGDPRFTNAASRVFTLEPGSAAIDAGTTLTTTATSGSGTTVRLTDAGYFHDGYGMIDGDTIQIGSTIVTITAINYATNDIVVQPGLTWTAGQSVSFPYTGVAPDMGAFESGSIIEEPPGGLQAYWRLDTGTGTSLVDATGNGHTGVLTDAAAWSPGHVGPRAVTFDGLGMKGTVTPAFAYTQYTWIMWIQGATAPSAAVNTQALVNGSDPDNWGFNWSNTTTSFMQAAYQQDASGAYVAAQLTTPLLAHVWYFVVATFDGSTLRVYLNGQLQASTAVSSVATGGGDFGLGNNPNRARWFAGSLDNVQVYNTAVSAAQILALYRTQAGAPRHRLLMR
jgi:hypothetical protein